MIFDIKNALRTLKASFGFQNKNMEPSKKSDVLINKKKCIDWFFSLPMSDPVASAQSKIPECLSSSTGLLRRTVLGKGSQSNATSDHG